MFSLPPLPYSQPKKHHFPSLVRKEIITPDNNFLTRDGILRQQSRCNTANEIGHDSADAATKIDSAFIYDSLLISLKKSF